MPLFTKDKSILFVHIPKCAGSSIIENFRNDNWNVEFLNEPAKNNVPDILPCNPQHYHQDLLEEYVLKNNKIDLEFTIVRNPFHRLISEMMWRIPMHSHRVDTEGFTKTFFDALENFLISRSRDHFIIEQDFKNNRQNYIERKQMLYYDNHIRPQKEFIGEDTKIFKLEEIESINIFLKDLNIKDLLKVNSSSNKSKPLNYDGFSNGFKDEYLKIYGDDHKLFEYPLPFEK